MVLGLLTAVLMGSVGSTPIAPINAGNALTLPAQRHLVRVDPGDGPAVWMLALQQGDKERHGLAFFRSDDETNTWRYYAPIQPDYRYLDRADIVAVGNDIALVYSFENWDLPGSAGHDVYFQWWRWHAATRDFIPQPPVRVFDSTSASTVYYRAELERDSLGRFWVQAFQMKSDGTHVAEIAVSADDGLTFAQKTPLAQFNGQRAGGRIKRAGDKLLFLYDTFGSHEGARMRIRHESDPLDFWQPEQMAFPEGIYHGAALSSASTDHGGIHLVYKDKAATLYYRYFDGSTFGPRQLIQANGDWAVQPAITLMGDDLIVFFSHNVSLNTNYDLRVTTLSNGVFSAPILLDNSVTFKGYIASAEEVPASVGAIPCIFSSTPDSSSSGTEVLVQYNPNTNPPSSPELTIKQPNGGETIRARSAYELEWSTTGSVSRVNLDFSSDYGKHWSRFASQIPNTNRYRITVPSIATNRGLVRISDAANSKVTDTSNSPFSIVR